MNNLYKIPTTEDEIRLKIQLLSVELIQNDNKSKRKLRATLYRGIFELINKKSRENQLEDDEDSYVFGEK